MRLFLHGYWDGGGVDLLMFEFLSQFVGENLIRFVCIIPEGFVLAAEFLFESLAKEVSDLCRLLVYFCLLSILFFSLIDCFLQQLLEMSSFFQEYEFVLLFLRISIAISFQGFVQSFLLNGFINNCLLIDLTHLCPSGK